MAKTNFSFPGHIYIYISNGTIFHLWLFIFLKPVIDMLHAVMSDSFPSVLFVSEVCFPGCRATTTTWWPQWSMHCVRNTGFLTR